jgi:hypothetical protein
MERRGETERVDGGIALHTSFRLYGFPKKNSRTRLRIFNFLIRTSRIVCMLRDVELLGTREKTIQPTAQFSANKDTANGYIDEEWRQ